MAWLLLPLSFARKCTISRVGTNFICDKISFRLKERRIKSCFPLKLFSCNKYVFENLITGVVLEELPKAPWKLIFEPRNSEHNPTKNLKRIDL